MFPFCIVELWRLEDTARRLTLSTEWYPVIQPRLPAIHPYAC